MINVIVSLLIAGIAGWLTGKIMNVNGNMVLNVLLGIVGGVVGNIALSIIGIHGSGFIGNVIVAVIGSCIVIWLVNKLTKK